jgi:hypothetical protein
MEIYSRIDNLSEDQRRMLAYFKALEITNASIKMGIVTAPQKLTYTVTKLVRELIQHKSVRVGEELISIEDPEVWSIVEHGLKLFNEWIIHRPSNSPSQALSSYLCTALSPWIYDGLVILRLNLSGYTDDYVVKITERFL